MSDKEKLSTIAALCVRPDTAEEAWIALTHIKKIVMDECEKQSVLSHYARYGVDIKI